MTSDIVLYESIQSNMVPSDWRELITASRHSNGSWSIIFETDDDDAGRTRETADGIEKPERFLQVLRSNDLIELDNQQIQDIVSQLFDHDPRLAAAAWVQDYVENGEDYGGDLNLESVQDVNEAFLASPIELPKPFQKACAFALAVFEELFLHASSSDFAATLSVDGVAITVTWPHHVKRSSRALSGARMIEEHVRQAHWETAMSRAYPGHYKSSMSRSQWHEKVVAYVSDYHQHHRELPRGRHDVQGLEVTFQDPV